MREDRRDIRSLKNAAWAFAVVVAAVLGLLGGSWRGDVDGKNAELLLLPSILGAALGVTCGLFGSLLVQHRRQRAQAMLNAVDLQLRLEEIERHIRREDVVRVGSDRATTLVKLLADLDDIAAAPRLGVAVDHGIQSLKRTARSLAELRREHDGGMSADFLQSEWQSTIVDLKAELTFLAAGLAPSRKGLGC